MHQFFAENISDIAQNGLRSSIARQGVQGINVSVELKIIIQSASAIGYMSAVTTYFSALNSYFSGATMDLTSILHVLLKCQADIARCFFSSQEKLFLQLGKNVWTVREEMNGEYTKRAARGSLFLTESC